MKIDATKTRSQLADDISKANKVADAASVQEQALDDVIADTSAGASEAYDNMHEYLDRLRRPAITLQHDFLVSYIEDMQRDDQCIAEKIEATLGPVVDTDATSSMIAGMRKQAQAACDTIDSISSFLPEGVISAVHEYADGLQDQAEQLQDNLDVALEYFGDSSIYAQSEGYVGDLGKSQQAIAGISVDPTTGAYDISAADLSWVQERNEEYWRKRNRQTLERYFVLDEEGNIVGIRKGMEDRIHALLDIVRKCLTEDGMPNEMGKLSPDERYVLTYLLTKLGPQVYEQGEEGAQKLVDIFGPDIAKQFIDLMSMANGGTIPIVTDKFSFTADDGVMYSIDVDGSVQKRNGFADITEMGGPALGMDLDTHITTFVYNGKEYRIQEWDGTYAFGLAYGGEIGVYCRDAPTSPSRRYEEMDANDIRKNLDTLTPQQTRSLFTAYRPVTGSNVPSVRIIVNTGGSDHIDRNAGNGYWTFDSKGVPRQPNGDPKHGYTKEDISVTGTLTFQDEGLAAAAEAALKRDGVSVQRNGGTLNVDWGK